MKFSFANRIDELRTLAKFCAASDIQDGVSIVVVHGAEGVGKSTVIRKAIHENFHDEHIHVEVSFNPYRDHESGTYIKNIAKEVSSFFQKEGSPFSLEAFLAKGYSGHLVRRVAESIGMDLAAIVPGLSGPVKELNTSAKEIMDLKNAILSNGNSETAELAANYVAHVAKSRKVIIHIQNFQNIDQVSLGTLEDNISLFRNVYFFLEWSDRDDKKYKDHNIVKQLKYAAPFTFKIEVGKLPIEELYEQILANQSIIYKLVASAYDKETGNLRDLERMLSSEHGLGVDLSIDRANTENLKSLSRARLVLIIIVCLTNEQASFDLLKEICATCDQKTRSLISNEISRDSDIYLTRTENGLKIDHDSTIRRVMTLADFDFERQYGAQIIKRYIDSKHATIKDMSVSTLLQYMQLSTICNDTDNLFWSLREFESKFQHSKFPPEILNQILDFSLRIVRLDSNN